MNVTFLRPMAGAAALTLTGLAFSAADARLLDIVQDEVSLTEDLCVRCLSARARSMPLEAALEFDIAMTERRQIALANRLSRISGDAVFTDFFAESFEAVSVEATPVSTPAPAALGLLATGLAGLGLMRRRRQ